MARERRVRWDLRDSRPGMKGACGGENVGRLDGLLKAARYHSELENIGSQTNTATAGSISREHGSQGLNL